MRTGTLLLATLAFIAAAMLVAAGCTTTPPTNQTTQATTPPAGTATVLPTANVTGTATAVGTATANAPPNGTMPMPSFTNTTWQWNALEVGANRTVVNDSASYTVLFRPNLTYALKADCNNGAGNYTVNGSELSLGPAAVTLAYCGEQSKDQLFLSSLMHATSYEIDRNGNLILNIREPVSRMIFSAPNTTRAGNITAPFVNATWRWIGRSGSETIQVPNPNQYTIAFNATGTYAIKADCNVGSGNYTLDGTKLRINQGALTRAYCGDNSLDRTYLASLGRVTSYVMDANGRLVLIMISPNERLIFEKVVTT
jgi:heat shock protein HslJ